MGYRVQGSIGCIGSRVTFWKSIFGKGVEGGIHGVRAFGSQGTRV